MLGIVGVNFVTSLMLYLMYVPEKHRDLFSYLMSLPYRIVVVFRALLDFSRVFFLLLIHVGELES